MVSNNGLLVSVLVGVYIGSNIGGRLILEPPVIASLCSNYNITKIRLPEPDTYLLDAFRDKDVSFTFDIPNAMLKTMNGNPGVENWFNKFIKPYINAFDFEYIIVGEDGHRNILPTMKLLQNLLNANNLTKVKLTTITSYDKLITKDPPSQGAFHPQIKDNLREILKFLAQQDSPDLMVNLYPFKKFIYDNRGVISIDYATFGAKAETVQDGKFLYRNLFDAMVDTIYAAIDKLGDKSLNKVTLLIGETGWPTNGREAYTTVALASAYNQKLIAHMRSGKGTPRRPNVNIEGFIRSLLNENGRPEGESRYYGIFNENSTPIYPLFPRN